MNFAGGRSWGRWWPAALGVLWTLTAVGSAAASGGAQGPPPKDPDRRCLQCHGQEKIGAMSPDERRTMVSTRLEAPPAGGEAPVPGMVEREPKAEGSGSGAGPVPPVRPALFVKPGTLAGSVHASAHCVDCHADAAVLPHAPSLNRATCASSCHAEAARLYETSAHRRAFDAKKPLAPTCVSCHGGHDVLATKDRRSPQSRLNSLHLCGDCHAKHEPGADGRKPDEWIGKYLESQHARGLTKAGLESAATCADCHTAHGVLPSKDVASSVHRSKIPDTCGKCHVGVVEAYRASVHGRRHDAHNEKAAVCTDCHTAHGITLASTPEFLRDVVAECGKCHDSAAHNGDRVGTYYQSYIRSYHGQVTSLGTGRAARCSDCHGSHDIRELSDPGSRVNATHLIGTCARCHPGANANFVRFDPHANHRDAKNYPVLHGVWLYFMVMMSAVFTLFGVHTILWFIRASIERRRQRSNHHHPAPAATAIRRFTRLNRINHFFVALTFFGLTATGIPLVFSDQHWAQHLAKLVGGVESAGLWHRFFAILLILNFGLHFVGLGMAYWRRKVPTWRWLFGPESLVPRWKDATDAAGMFAWFLGRKHRPSLDRWTYWEKFDYWAEVGGSMIIGGSGLLLWFPETASRVLPGWIFNIAMIVHGYEALLAIGFIFTIHFFNAHLRPGMFPVDEVMFTGSVPEHELEEQRPEEYKRLIETGRLESLRVPAPNRSRRPLWVVIAVVSVSIGLVLLGLIVKGGLS